jgi:hypothetical protein
MLVRLLKLIRSYGHTAIITRLIKRITLGHYNTDKFML